MTQEAKAYGEAVKKASIAYKDGDKHLKATLERIFPELKESEDEKIRKDLIQWIDDFPDIIWRGHHKKDILAWLENQDKQKPDWSEEDEKIRKAIIEHFSRGIEVEFPELEEKYNTWIAWLEKQGKHSIYNVPSRDVILAIWDLGNEWKELTNGCISTEYGNQLDYIQKHWEESEYYLREKQGKQKTIWHNEDEEPQRGRLVLLIMQSGTAIVAKIIEPNHNFSHGERWAYIDDLLEKQGEKPQGKSEQEYFEWDDEDNENMNSLCVLLDQMVSINAIGNEHSVEYKNWLKSLKERIGEK